MPKTENTRTDGSKKGRRERGTRPTSRLSNRQRGNTTYSDEGVSVTATISAAENEDVNTLGTTKVSGTADGQNLATKRGSSSLMPTLLLFGFIIAVGAILIAISIGAFDQGTSTTESPTRGAIPENYDPRRAMTYLRELCAIGPRPSGSEGMKRQQRYLESFFTERGATIEKQSFETRNPNDGTPVTMTNLIASWNTDVKQRYIFCAHYDTRPYPDRDPDNRKGVFIGANDGASGTAGLMELANQFDELPADLGVDLVMFDGEEFVWEEGRDSYFLGSTYFAKQYADDSSRGRYQAGVLFDMIGDKELKIHYETNSMRYAKPVARSFWKEAQRLGVRAFVMRERHTIRDDHIPLNEIANIPTIDVIDFDYPRPGIGAPSYWHTQQDTPENCSGESIAAVVWVAHQWLLSKSPSANR